MVRVVLYLFLAIVLISLIRSVIGILGKAIGGFLGPAASGRAPSSGPPKVGELKRAGHWGGLSEAAVVDRPGSTRLLPENWGTLIFLNQ